MRGHNITETMKNIIKHRNIEAQAKPTKRKHMFCWLVGAFSRLNLNICIIILGMDAASLDIFMEHNILSVAFVSLPLISVSGVWL